MANPLLGAPFETFNLIGVVLSEEPSGTDDWGNPIFDAAEMHEFKALLGPARHASQLVMLEGADVKMMPMRGELLAPLKFPPGIRVGSELAVEYNDFTWTLTLTSLTPNDLVGVDFGMSFLGTMLPETPDFVKFLNKNTWTFFTDHAWKFLDG